jgi:formate dehydrogenase subunit gamma
MGGTIALLALFWLLRGRIRIEKGWAGYNIVRFSRLERLVHWLLALSFVVLLVTGVVMRAGDFSSSQGPSADVVLRGAMLHFWSAVAFAVALLFAFLLWVRYSLPHWRDVVWVLRGGGLLVRGVHPAAGKFNAGQKVLFWLTVIGGAPLALLGIALLFVPGSSAFLDGSLLALLRLLSVELPAKPSQYLFRWHGVIALVLACPIIVHIYLRTLGIQGAASAMISGEVDANWAKQHHSLWAEEELRRMEDTAEPDRGDTLASPKQ